MFPRKLTFASLAFYIVCLAATQTVYGRMFFSMRWVALILLFVLSGFTSLLQGSRRVPDDVNVRVSLYLLLWGVTIVGGLYPLFSTYRFAAHAMVLLSSLIFIPRIFDASDSSRFLIFIKFTIAAVLIVSYLKPAPLTDFDVSYQFRGVFGNSNALGHVAAIGFLLYFHGFVTGRGTRFAKLQLLLLLLSGYLVLRSGARSSFIALIAGLIVWLFARGRVSSRNVVIGWSLVLCIAMAAVTIGPRIRLFLLKTQDARESGISMETLTFSRLPTWTTSWQSFKEHPLLGTGFGVDSDTDLSNWNGELSAVGLSKRDTVNDVTYTLETGGIAGLAAYLLLLSIIPKLWVRRQTIQALTSLINPNRISRAVTIYETQQVFMCLSVMLTVLFEMDDTALSAGNLPSALLWLAIGMSTGLRSILVNELPIEMLNASQPYYPLVIRKA